MNNSRACLSIFLVLFIFIGCDNSDNSWYVFDDIKLSESINDSTNNRSNLSYEWEALLVDIPLPEIVDLSGRAKLIRHDKSNHAIGYEIEVRVDSLKSDDIPEEYREKRSIEIGQTKDLEVLPLKEVVYEVLFEFTLLDKDGFEIEKIKSETHNIRSGIINRLKSKTDYQVSPSKASLLGAIELDMRVTKCISCK